VGKGGVSCREAAEWAVREGAWVAPVAERDVGAAAKVAGWEAMRLPARAESASALPAGIVSPMCGVCRAQR
jgi:hypothetical protein